MKKAQFVKALGGTLTNVGSLKVQLTPSSKGGHAELVSYSYSLGLSTKPLDSAMRVLFMSLKSIDSAGFKLALLQKHIALRDVKLLHGLYLPVVF